MKDLILEAQEKQRPLVDLAVERWDKVLQEGSDFDGWQDDIRIRHKMETTAVLIENQYQSLKKSVQAGILKADIVPSQQVLLETEGTHTSDVTSFTTQMIAMIRKTYAPSFVFDLFGVQALTSDTAFIFYEKWIYNTSKGQTAKGDQIMRNNTGTGFTMDPFYTSEKVENETIENALNTDLSAGVVKTSTLPFTPVKANTIVAKLINAADGTITGSASFDASGVCTAVTGSGITALTTDHTFNTSTSLLTVKLDGVFTGGGLGTHNLRVSYRYSLEDTSNQPLIKITYDKQSVEVQNRLVRFEWTRFSETDTRSKFGIDLASRYQDLGAMQLRSETERQLLSEAFDGAYTTINFDYAAAFTAGNYDDRNKALYAKIKDVQNLIYRLTLRGPGNWFVATTEIASKLDTFTKSPTTQITTSGSGLRFSGTLDNGLSIYIDPLNVPTGTTHRCLVGYKGLNPEDAGLFLAPYEPASLTERVVDPTSLNYIQAAYSRYAIDFIEDGSRFYVVLEIDNVG